MHMLFSFVEKDEPLHNGLAGYFGRVVCSLLYKSGPETLQYMQNNRHVLDNLLKHTSSSSVGEIIIRVAASDEEWVAETSLVESLLEKLKEHETLDVQVKAAEVLCGINTDIFQFSNPVKQKMYDRQNIERLCSCAFDSSDKIMVPAIMVFTNLLVGVGQIGEGEDETLPDGTRPGAAIEAFRAAVFEVVLHHMHRIVALLDVVDDTRVQEMPYGVIRPTFGISRLRVVELLRVLLWIARGEVEAALISSRALCKCLDVFVKYPFNNLLHSSVEGLVTLALDDGTPALAQHLVADFDLATFVARAPIEVTPEPLPNSARPAQTLRAGYVGHLTRIANKLLDQASKREDIQRVLNGNAQWKEFVGTTLETCNRNDNIDTWQCGRPTQEFFAEDEDMVRSCPSLHLLDCCSGVVRNSASMHARNPQLTLYSFSQIHI
jgi:serine/threonine-protein phosphatase 6 regulatory subunit 3